jgi:hypothetical protein
MINKFFAVYGTVVILLFATATHQGYVFSSLFSNTGHTGPNQNRYHK